MFLLKTKRAFRADAERRVLKFSYFSAFLLSSSFRLLVLDGCCRRNHSSACLFSCAYHLFPSWYELMLMNIDYRRKDRKSFEGKETVLRPIFRVCAAPGRPEYGHHPASPGAGTAQPPNG